MAPRFHLDRRGFVSGTCCTLAMTSRRASATEPAVVEIENGKLRGIHANGAMCFKGIPYAASTEGANRFMAPRPVENWAGVRAADAFGDRCPQEQSAEANLIPDGTDWFSWYYRKDATYSENCCVLNLFTPNLDSSAKRPVMVYIHGGGFRSGGGDGSGLDGSNLARLGNVVVVTLNHRLNLLGYLQLGHLDEDFADAGNAGQLDLIAALRWISANIAVFGGDPNRVLLFGQSGGGSKIATLMIMPGARALLHRAVNMSGTTAYDMGPAQEREPVTDAFMRHLGLARGDLRKLQKLPPEQLLMAYRQTVTEMKMDDFRPVIDGRHIPHGPLTPEGLAVHADVPMMMGTTETEASFWLARNRRNISATSDEVKRRIMAQFDLNEVGADAIYRAYRDDAQNRTPWDILAALATDVLFRHRMLVGAEAKARACQAPVYLYNFSWPLPVDGGIWRSPHTADIPFAFGNVDRASVMTGAGSIPHAVENSLMSAFIAFARNGNPDNAAMPHWVPYDVGNRQTMTVDHPCRLISDFLGGGRKASDALMGQAAYQILGGPLFRADP
ncbi:carboxylesterase family protein [Sphingobium sp. H39-3-25]|uniref:carboxylesterase/lipase family protein n=1 Tax=Sphingobium arseniciresistens TaxID=3030834 RepID=UPI0023BA3B39|nr:carboxylesterase family protein [Sphingobium arseniciresistens]